MAEYSDETALKLDMSLDELIGEENKAIHNSTHEHDMGFIGRKKHKSNNGIIHREKRILNTLNDQPGLIKQPPHLLPFPQASPSLIHNPNNFPTLGLHSQHLYKTVPPPPPLLTPPAKHLPPHDNLRPPSSTAMKRPRPTPSTNQPVMRQTIPSINTQKGSPILGLIPTPSTSHCPLTNRSDELSMSTKTGQTSPQSSLHTPIHRTNLESETNDRKAQLPQPNGIIATPNQSPPNGPSTLATSNYQYNHSHTYHHNRLNQHLMNDHTIRPYPTQSSDNNQAPIYNLPHHNTPHLHHGNYYNQHHNYLYTYDKPQDRKLPNVLGSSQAQYDIKRIELNPYKKKNMPPSTPIMHTHPTNDLHTMRPRYTNLAENEDRSRMSVNNNRLFPRRPTSMYPIHPQKHTHTPPTTTTTTTKLPANTQSPNNTLDYQNPHFHHYQETTASDNNTSYTNQPTHILKTSYTPPKTTTKSMPTVYQTGRGRTPPRTPNTPHLQYLKPLLNNGQTHINDDKSTIPASKMNVTGYNVIVTNVPHNLTAIDIQEAFSLLGDIIRTDIMLTSLGEHTGRVSVTYSTHSSAQEAVCQFDGGDLNGNTIRVFLE